MFSRGLPHGPPQDDSVVPFHYFEHLIEQVSLEMTAVRHDHLETSLREPTE